MIEELIDDNSMTVSKQPDGYCHRHTVILVIMMVVAYIFYIVDHVTKAYIGQTFHRDHTQNKGM